MGAGAVKVRFLVSSYGKLRDMRAHHLSRKIELHITRARATLALISQREAMSIGHEVHRHPRPAIKLGITGKEVLIIAFKPVCKAKVVLKDEVGIVEKIHHQRSVGDGEVTRRLRAAAVE